MSIASEITRINGNIAAAYTALDGKGATLPAAGSQNSANLADTIATITTGGGGGGYRPPVYDTVEQIVDSTYYGITFPELRELGFRDIAGGNWSGKVAGYIVGLVFGENLRGQTFYRKGGQTGHILCGSGVTITASDTNNNSNTIYTITFGETGDLYLIYQLQSSTSILAYWYVEQSPSTTNGMAFQVVNSIEFIAIHSLYSSLDEMALSSSIFNLFLPNLKDVFLKNCKLQLGYGVSSSSTFTPGMSCGGWLTHNEFLSPRKKASLFSNISFQDTIYVSHADLFNCLNAGRWVGLINFPFAIDFSGYTSRDDVTTYVVGGLYSSANLRARMQTKYVKDFYFIPRPAWSIDWSRGLSGQMDDVPSKDAISYFASHCPTVSGKTFKVGTYALNNLEVTCPTELATIRSKGYTIE